VDLTSFEAVEALVGDVVATHGRLDAVIHLVGGFVWGPAHDASAADYGRMMDLNVRTLVAVTQAALPVFRAQGTGWLAGVAAGQAWRGGAADVALYAASKAAVAAYLRSVDAEQAGTDIGVCILFPMGVIDTPANRSAMPEADTNTWIDPRGLGEALVFAATRDRRARCLELPVHGGRA
jgi:NAD(P)-dependent dehydrogenase (short-subunit alcohol dehydrogenase family)